MNYSIAIYSYNYHQNLLPYTLKSIHNNVSGYSEIVLVWDDFVRDIPVDFNSIRQSTGVDFRVVKHTELFNWPSSIQQWGWIRQQLAKMLCYTYINDDYTWIVDSDVLVHSEPELFSDRPILRYDQTQAPSTDYIPFMKQLGLTDVNEYTYVGSTALFDHTILEHIFDQYPIVSMVDQMLESKNHTELPFSEFEIYGHYAVKHFSDSVDVQKRNWVYGNRNMLFPIQVEWADNSDLDLDTKYNTITSY